MFLAELKGEDSGKDTESESYTEYEPDCKVLVDAHGFAGLTKIRPQ